ncbi:hypothetical protein C7M52_03216 [Mixta theicola]|nr:tight adherance operon protein [Mixta theicola]QHM77220.1 hypothetical protein C7M52_03216 [Mixta theicola]
MLLFPQKEEKAAFTEKTFYVLSARADVNERLCQMLHLAGFNQIESRHQRIGQIGNLELSPHAYGVIIDIENLEQTDDIITAVQAIVPRNVWCCLVGDSDSIVLAQTFSRHGLFYFYLSAQSEDLIQAAMNGVVKKTQRKAIAISVLGCKGGNGNTAISWDLANRISQLRKMPTLFIQGGAGSQDLDLLIGCKLVQEINPVNKNLDAMSWKEESFPEVERELFDKYNFLIMEESIVSADKEVLRQIAEKSSCLIALMDRSMASIRIVRHIMEIVDAIKRSQRAPKRLILCLNDSRPVTMDMLSLEDIQSLLGRPIDIYFPYRKKGLLSALPFLQRERPPIESLTLKVLGESEPVKNPLLRQFGGRKGKR